MKKQLLHFFTIMLVFSMPTYAQLSERIAIVNIAKIFQQSPQKILVEKKIDNEFRKRINIIQSIENSLQNKIQRLRKNNLKYNERIALEKSLLEERDTLSKKTRSFEEDHRKRQIEEKEKILLCIQNLVKKVATQDGYDAVIDANVIIYAKNIRDITEKVIQYIK